MKPLHLFALPVGLAALLMAATLMQHKPAPIPVDATIPLAGTARVAPPVDSPGPRLPAACRPRWVTPMIISNPQRTLRWDEPFTRLRIPITGSTLGQFGYRVWLCEGMIFSSPETAEAELANTDSTYGDDVLAYLHESLSLPSSPAPETRTDDRPVDARQYGIYGHPVDTAEADARTWLQEQLETMVGMDPGIFVHGPDLHDPAAMTEVLRQVQELNRELRANTVQDISGLPTDTVLNTHQTTSP